MHLTRLIKYFKTIFYYKLIFKKIGSRSVLISPLKINGGKRILIGDRVIIAYKTWIAALPLTRNDNCKLVIKDGTSIGNFNHIYATKSIVIGTNVLTADKVYISDNLHSYEKINLPIIKQEIKQISTVTIGDGAWLGENVCVIGANIGKNSVIGANSVVTKHIPDYCIAVGVPAKVIKRYCFKSKTWRSTNFDGIIINNKE